MTAATDNGDEVAGVLAGRRPWALAPPGDCLAWMAGLPDRSVDLAFTSPPYERARTYGASVGFRLAGQAWVDWMAPRVMQMCRVSRGLALVNMAGQVRDGSYSPAVEWLVADLTRVHGLVCGPAPYVYFRYGIPGSGGGRYHRRDWEPVYAFCLPDRLPLAWSDNTAEGHPPRWAPGGAMSHRLSDGSRVNQWGGRPTSARSRRQDCQRQPPGRPSHGYGCEGEGQGEAPGGGLFGPEGEGEGDGGGASTTINPLTRRPTGLHFCNRPTGYEGPAPPKKRKKVITRPREGQHSQESTEYEPPALANPGNVIRERYDAEEVRRLVEGLVTQRLEPGDVVYCLAGGNHLGSRLAHENEAPFPERLAEFFLRSYCPPGGVVLDPFMGSGTAGAVALREGRRFLGCDLRPSQVELAGRRLGAVTPGLPFDEEGGGRT